MDNELLTSHESIRIKRMLESFVLPIKRVFRTFLFSLLSLYRLKNPSPE